MLVLTTAALAGNAWGSPTEGCVVHDGPADEVHARLVAIRAQMSEEAARAVAWSAGWAATGVALAFAGYTRAAVTPEGGDRSDLIVTGTASLVVPVAIFASPLRVIGEANALEDEARGGDRPGEDCARLARAEEARARSADDEARKVGPVAHLLNAAGSVALGAFLALVLRHGWSGLLNGVGGFALGEIQIATQPTGLLGDARGIPVVTGGGGAPAPPPRRADRTSFSLAPSAQGGARGLTLTIAF
jgi:hypothetical protein